MFMEPIYEAETVLMRAEFALDMGKMRYSCGVPFYGVLVFACLIRIEIEVSIAERGGEGAEEGSNGGLNVAV